MQNDKIICAWDRMNPDSNAKKRILQKIQDTMETSERSNFKKVVQRFAVGFAAAFILLLGSLGTAYAASPAFREYVHSVLFPRYTSDEIISIDNGHMTGVFDQTDVLLSFLDRFNRFEFGNSVTAVMEDGYHYSLFAQDDNRLRAFVDSNVPEYCIVVYMEQLEYENTEGIWQVTGYQILENSDAETMKNQLEPYSEKLSEGMVSAPQEDTSIKVMENSVVIYNVNEKKNVVSLNEDDGRVICGILDGCGKQEDIVGGLFQYVIKVNDISYMFDLKGNGMVADSGNHWGILIPEKDLDVIIELFKSYHVPLEETE